MSDTTHERVIKKRKRSYEGVRMDWYGHATVFPNPFQMATDFTRYGTLRTWIEQVKLAEKFVGSECKILDVSDCKEENAFIDVVESVAYIQHQDTFDDVTAEGWCEEELMFCMKHDTFIATVNIHGTVGLCRGVCEGLVDCFSMENIDIGPRFRRFFKTDDAIVKFVLRYIKEYSVALGNSKFIE
jgi:hypothetical protein